MKKNTKNILWILGIMASLVLAIIAVLNWADIKPNGNSIIQKDPFQISISPSSINEGQYEKFDKKLLFTITIIPNFNLNITSFELSRNNIIVDRLNKNSQTAFSERFCISDSSHPDCYYDFLFQCPSYSWHHENCNKKYEASVVLEGCQNCFYGSSFPYQITFTINYAEDGDKKTFTKSIEIPIND